MSSTDMTGEEMANSLTGFDEIAIEKLMKVDVYTDAERKPILVTRGLVFVHLTRQGITGPDARQQAMEMPLKVVQDYFATDDEIDPEEPETPAGEDNSQPG